MFEIAAARVDIIIELGQPVTMAIAAGHGQPPAGFVLGYFRTTQPAREEFNFHR
jgi:hypothetical protein